MKKIISLVLVMTLLVSFSVSLTGCKKDTKELNLFNWTEYLPQEVIDQFEAETGIKVNYNTYSSNEEMLAKV
ncbi:MAG: spermidine/putrescine ABC transporter permease, partial [Vallitaleaceae bacterium]|nr:spermidine/putrescine ABC transporter permease [Vallitaleaceae bacterium]